YRTVVLLRFFEGLTPAEIAARTGERPGTVRMRLKRGLALLRGRLDAESAAGRREWAVAIVPLLALPRGGSVAPIAAGGLLMKLSTKVAVAAALVLLLAGGAAMWPRPVHAPAPSPTEPAPVA